MSWIHVYKEEEKLLSAHKSNSNAPITPPTGYKPSTYSDIDNGIKHDPIIANNSNNHQLVEYKKKKLWEIATAPAKSILMNIGMNYMSPNDIQFIPIMMLIMLFVNTTKDLFMINEKFNIYKNIDIDPIDLSMIKFVYVISCFGNFLVGIWKLNNMGLIPNHSSDWLAWEGKLESLEIFI